MTLKEFLVQQRIIIGFAEARRMALSEIIQVNGEVVLDADYILHTGDRIVLSTKPKRVMVVGTIIHE